MFKKATDIQSNHAKSEEVIIRFQGYCIVRASFSLSSVRLFDTLCLIVFLSAVEEEKRKEAGVDDVGKDWMESRFRGSGVKSGKSAHARMCMCYSGGTGRVCSFQARHPRMRFG